MPIWSRIYLIISLLITLVFPLGYHLPLVLSAHASIIDNFAHQTTLLPVSPFVLPHMVHSKIETNSLSVTSLINTTPSTKTITIIEPATLLPTPPVDISISKFVLGEISFNQKFVAINQLCFHFAFSNTNPVDPNESVSFIGAPGLDGAGFINIYDYPLYFFSRCFSAGETTNLFLDGQEYFGVRMDPGFGANLEGTAIISSLKVEVEGVVNEYLLYLPLMVKR